MVTELLGGTLEVRCRADGGVQSVRLATGWRAVVRIANHWIVETDWWRTPTRRHYLRVLLSGDECIEIYRDLTTDTWHLVRRYD